MENPLEPKEIEEFFENLKRWSLKEFEGLLKCGGCDSELHEEYPFLLIMLAASRAIESRLHAFRKLDRTKREISNLKHF